VDVVLVLLLIFMITAPILQSGIEVDLPKTKTVKEISEARLVVTIDRSQRVYLGDTPINIHDLGNQVRAKTTDPAHQPVFLRSDETVPFGSVTTVLDALQQAGVLNVQIVTKPLTERAQSQ
jgi:biopolymer transport protein ExbD/biopolymer transport protein TolR